MEPSRDNINRMRLLLSLILILCLCMAELCAEEVSVRWIEPQRGFVAKTHVAELDLFVDQPCLLAWQITAAPGTVMSLQGQVFQASSRIAVPLKELSFEVQTTFLANQVQVEARHRLELPQKGKPAAYLIKWQAHHGEAAAATGLVHVRLSTRGLLTPLKHVSIVARDDLSALAQVLESDGVKVVMLEGAEELPSWEGTLIIQANTAALDKIRNLPLGKRQTLLVFGDLANLPDVALAKTAGEGRLVILPAHHLRRFPSSPAMQRLVVELCQPST